MVHACHEEATRAGAQLFRWHPLLTGNGTFLPRPEWQAIGLDGEPVPGFQAKPRSREAGLPEFTFVCPNRPAVREAVWHHLEEPLVGGDYDGVFLDRIRYPSPAADPARLLACFCGDCRRIAATEGLDLEDVRRRIRALLATPEGTLAYVRALLDPPPPGTQDPDLAALHAFLDFRARSVARFVQASAGLVHAAGLAVGLDCFSPALAPLVGQDLGALNGHCEWVKIMTYGHALGPAGLPFELLDLANWLVGDQPGSGRSGRTWALGQGLAAVASEVEALELLSLATRLPLPRTRAALRERGLAPGALAAETRRGRAAGVHPLFAGIELVEIDGLAQLNQEQIEADLHAFRDAGADGLVLSWDLWHIPLERLDFVRAIWGGG